MSSLHPDYVVPEAVVAKVRPMWEAAFDDETPFAGKPIEIHIPLDSRVRVQELFGGLRDAFGAVSRAAEPKAVIMSSQEWADARKLGRDVLDIGDDVGLYPLGVQARLWGALVITNSVGNWFVKYGRSGWIRRGFVLVVGRQDDGSWVRQEIRVKRDV